MFYKNALTIVGILISTVSISQETITHTNLSTSNHQISLSRITEVSKNQLSDSLTAHTYKLVDGNMSGITDTNSNLLPNTSSIEGMINAFLEVEGVSRCTFDNATQTFTILSSPSTSLTQAIRSINNNE